jgi:hypothetical protein
MTKRERDIGLELLETWKQQIKEHKEALDALGKTFSSKDIISEAECEKFEAELDALELREKQQFNAAMAKAKARGLVLH